MLKVALSKRKKQWCVIIFLFLLFATPFLLAEYFFYDYGPKMVSIFGTVNKGKLITPPVLLKNVLKVAESESSNLDNLVQYTTASQLKPKWYILCVIRPECNDPIKNPAEKTIDKIQRIRLSLGKEFSKVGILLAGSENALEKIPPLKEGDNFIPEIIFSEKGVDKLLDVVETSSETAEAIFIMDPKQNIFMAYPADVKSDAIYKDIERLLKYANE